MAQILLTLPTQEEAELAKAAESIADEIFRPETPPVVFLDTKTGESWVPTQEEPELAKAAQTRAASTNSNSSFPSLESLL